MKMLTEDYNYTDVCIMLDALTESLGRKEGSIGTYKLQLLRKLERNKQTLYNNFEGEGDTSGEV